MSTGGVVKDVAEAGSDLASGDYADAGASVAGDVAQATLGRVPVVGSVLAGAAEGAVTGVAVTEGVTEGVDLATTATTLVAAAAGDASTALTALGVGSAIGNLIPLPGIGAAIGAVVGALVALGEVLSSAFSDTFAPTPIEAEAWLTVFRLNLCFLFSGVDNAITPEQAARLVAYLKITADEVKKGQKGNTGERYNPVSNDSCSNPYMCRVDPDDPMTDASYLRSVQAECQASQRNAGRWFDHGPWQNTIAGRLAANLAGKTITDGKTFWRVDHDGFVTPTSGPASKAAPPATGSEVLTILDVKGAQHTGRPLAGTHGDLPAIGSVGTLSQNFAIFPNAPWMGAPGTDANHAPGTLHTGDQLKVLDLPSQLYQGQRWTKVQLLGGSTDNISVGYVGWLPANLVWPAGAATTGVAAGWTERPTVLVDMPRVGLLQSDTKGWATPTIGHVPGMPLIGDKYAAGTTVVEVQPKTPVVGWSYAQVADGSGLAFWVPWTIVAWNDPEQHLWQMQLENEGSPTVIQTPAQARGVLKVLRGTLTKSGIAGWSEFNKDALAFEVRAVRRLAGDTGPDPVLDPLLGSTAPVSAGPLKTAGGPLTMGDWLFLAGIGVVSVGVGAAVVAWKLKEAGVNALAPASKPRPRIFESPGQQAFRDLVFNGIRDGDLQFRRGGSASTSLYCHKAFNDARVLGISPTELAVSGRYFGEIVMPIRIAVHADGTIHLVDGRQRYAAAKDAGATSILAEVVLYDLAGDVVAERLVPVQLL